MTTEETARLIGEAFIHTLRMRLPELLEPLLSDEVVWSLPGASRISGEAIGTEAVLQRVRIIGSVGMHLELKHLLIGLNGVALSLHNTASHEGRSFDMHLVTALTISGGKIVHINTFMHDLAMLNKFFQS